MTRTGLLGWCALAAAAALSAGGCASYSKVCSDGVCEITQNGQTRYEGDPEKVAKLQQKKAEQAEAEAAHQAKLDAAPRRGAGEPVRVALVANGASDPELAALQGAYLDMLRAELSGDPSIEVAEQRLVDRAVGYARESSRPGSFRATDDRPKPLRFDAETLRRLRYAGLPADVVVFTSLAPKTKTGLIGGGRGQGAGLAQVTLVQFTGQFSSAYNFKEHSASEVGESVSNLAMAGLDKGGKARSAELKMKRDVSKDRAAVRRYAQAIKARIKGEIRATLPSLASAKKVEAELKPAGLDGAEDLGQAVQKLKSLFGK